MQAIRYQIRSLALLSIVNEINAKRLVPDAYFQRNLVWRDVHKRDFIETILLGYPFPQIFFSRGKIDVKKMSSTACIVDGQQRMTSIVILLQSIQSYFDMQAEYKTLANGITKKFLFATRLSDNNSFFKLTLNADCRDFFKTDILGKPGVTGATIRSHQRLATAKKTFNEYLL